MKRICWGFERGKSYNPEFCFGISDPKGARYPNLVGCRQMALHICCLGGVYHYGKWINLRGDFLYDDGLMGNFVKTARKEYPDCPFMDTERAYRFIFYWPRMVNPNEDERLTIWPPVIGRLQNELLNMGLSLSGPPPTPNGEEYPIFTDTSFLLELINNVYGESIEDKVLKKVLFDCYNEICEQTIQYFD